MRSFATFFSFLLGLCLVLLPTEAGAAPPTPEAIPPTPCIYAAHDASVGLVGALRLAHHLAQREKSGALNAAAQKQLQSALLGEIQLAHDLAQKAVAARNAAKDAKSAAALANVDHILIGLIKGLKQAKAIKDPYAGLAGKLFMLHAASAKTVGVYTKHLPVRALAVVLGLSLKHGLVPSAKTPENAQLVAASWLIGEEGIAATLVKDAATLSSAKVAAKNLGTARLAFMKQKGSLANLDQAHASLVGILIAL
jgi:hypothetical protein